MKIDLIDRMRDGVRRLGLASWLLAQRNLMRSQIVYKINCFAHESYPDTRKPDTGSLIGCIKTALLRNHIVALTLQFMLLNFTTLSSHNRWISLSSPSTSSHFAAFVCNHNKWVKNKDNSACML